MSDHGIEVMFKILAAIISLLLLTWIQNRKMGRK